jgi:hypothetical protein
MGAGAVYGIVARTLVDRKLFGGMFGETFAVMSLAFLFVVPAVIGAITVSAAEKPSVIYRIFAPWVPIVLLVAAAALIGWEGSICIYMGLPVLLVMASIGGLVGGGAARRASVRPLLLVAPLLLSPLEQMVRAPDRLRQTTTEIVIAAPPSVVWPLVASVDSIRPDEQRPALFTRLGFPRPVSATLSHRGVGGIRVARFERGLAFTETVTEWTLGQRLSFTIDASTDTVGGLALDEHVTIGGPYFDVMTGTYELYPLEDGQVTRLVLRSEHRTSTRFNFYAGWWVDRIMTSIQDNIMVVHKSRAEQSWRRIALRNGT